MTNHRIAWFSLGVSTAMVTDSDGNDLDRIPLESAFTEDEWQPELGLQFIRETLNAAYGIDGWRNHGQPLRDDERGSVGIDFDLMV